MGRGWTGRMDVRRGVVLVVDRRPVDRTAYPAVGIRTIGPVGGIEKDWRVREVGEEGKKGGAGDSAENQHRD